MYFYSYASATFYHDLECADGCQLTSVEWLQRNGCILPTILDVTCLSSRTRIAVLEYSTTVATDMNNLSPIKIKVRFELGVISVAVHAKTK